MLSSQCSGLRLLSRPSLEVSLSKESAAPWASLTSWQGRPSQLPPLPSQHPSQPHGNSPTCSQLPRPACWVGALRTCLEQAGVSALKVLYFLEFGRRHRRRVPAKPRIFGHPWLPQPWAPCPAHQDHFLASHSYLNFKGGQQKNFVCNSSLWKRGEEQVV